MWINRYIYCYRLGTRVKVQKKKNEKLFHLTKCVCAINDNENELPTNATRVTKSNDSVLKIGPTFEFFHRQLKRNVTSTT